MQLLWAESKVVRTFTGLRGERMGIHNVLWLSLSFGGSLIPHFTVRSKATDSVGSSIHGGFPKPGPGSPVVQPNCNLTVSVHLWGCSASATAVHTDNGCACSAQKSKLFLYLWPVLSFMKVVFLLTLGLLSIAI